MKKAAVIFILQAGIIWGCTGPYVRTLSGFGLESIEIAAIRCLTSAAAMLLGMLAFQRKHLRIRLKDGWVFVGTGILSVTFYYCCYFTTIMLTSLSIAAVLLYTSPVFVMILSAVFFGERLNRRKMLALVLTVMGCVFASGVLAGSTRLSLVGIGIGICSGFGYALYSVFSRAALNRGYSSFTITFYTMLLAGLCLMLLSDRGHILFCVGNMDRGSILFMITISLLVTLIPFLSYTAGLRYMETGRAAVIVAIEPVTAAVLGILVYHEQMTFAIFIGMALVLGAIVLIHTDSAGSL